MISIKVFDVVKLKNDDKATILRVNDKFSLVEIAGENKKHSLISNSDIEKVIYRNGIGGKNGPTINIEN